MVIIVCKQDTEKWRDSLVLMADHVAFSLKRDHAVVSLVSHGYWVIGVTATHFVPVAASVHKNDKYIVNVKMVL